MIKLLKAIISLMLSVFFCFTIVFVICAYLEQGIIGEMICLIIFNLIMLWYVNWSIWTKGKVKKFVLLIILLLIMIISYE